jgi:hypothetical protein
MNPLQRASLACTLGFSTLAFASDAPHTILPDNVVVCQASAGCTNKALFGRTYKVITTSRFTIMVSLSKESDYTRADVSISNNTDMPVRLTPEDFRVEVITPKPKVLLYIPPSDLKDLPAPIPNATADAPSAPAATVSAPSTAITPATANPAPAATPTHVESAKAPDIDALYEAKKKQLAEQEAADKAAAQKHLPAGSIAPNAVLRGRVYFERDKREKRSESVNVVLPLAGLVFEFPYTLQP